jgi:hypothetical protein
MTHLSLQILISAIVFCASAATPKFTINCESTDPNIRPYYKIKIQSAKVNVPNYYTVDVVRFDDLSGQRNRVSQREGPGQIYQDAFVFRLGKMKDGAFSYQGESIHGFRLLNGVVKAELRMHQLPTTWLACR